MNCCKMLLAGSMRAKYFEVRQTPSWPSHLLAVGPLGMGFPSASMKRISPKFTSRMLDSILARSPTTTQTMLSGWITVWRRHPDRLSSTLGSYLPWCHNNRHAIEIAQDP